MGIKLHYFLYSFIYQKTVYVSVALEAEIVFDGRKMTTCPNQWTPSYLQLAVIGANWSFEFYSLWPCQNLLTIFGLE